MSERSATAALSASTTPAGALRDGQASPAAQAAQQRVQRRQQAEAPGIYEALRASHALQRALCRQITRIPGSQPDKRLAVFRSLKLELAAHAAAEERYLYVPMLMHDNGLDPSRHALHEHHQMDEMVEDIEALAADGSAWMDHVKLLAHKVRHHLKEEETKFFQASGKLLSAPQKQQLGRRYLRDHSRMLTLLAQEGR